ncbi:MAG: hypothetical protein ACYTFW_25075 [Planctomycetota bacterium]|jgi:hypothetical protein
MAYFSNGTEGEIYREKYCAKCIHEEDCVIWDLHLLWNYDAVGKDADKTKSMALNTLIPVDGIQNLECKYFVLLVGE